MSLASTAPGLLSDKEGYRRTADLFGEDGTVDAYLAFERALAEVQAELGILPQDAAARIVEACRREALDMDALRCAASRIGYPIVPLVEQLAKRAGPLGQWIHFGTTTQDVMDTALALQIRAAGNAILADLSRLEAMLARLAEVHRHTAMIGRSKLQHAVPITFGYKVAVWLDQLVRRRMALTQAVQAASVLQFGGATGTLASLTSKGMAVRAALAKRLGLTEPDISWHVTRDRVVDVIYAHASLAAALAKIALDIAHMMSTEVNELWEPAADGRGSSSTMPQKRNPVLCEAIIEAARDVRGYPARALDAMLQDHERAIGHGYGERRALAAAMTETAGAVSLALDLIEGLEVNTARMALNLGRSSGLAYAEAAMMHLAAQFGRIEAHHVLRRVCRRVTEAGITLRQALEEAGLDVPAEVFRPEGYTGSQSAMIDQVVARARG